MSCSKCKKDKCGGACTPPNNPGPVYAFPLSSFVWTGEPIECNGVVVNTGDSIDAALLQVIQRVCNIEIPPQGEQGVQGIQGEQGVQGERGPAGESIINIPQLQLHVTGGDKVHVRLMPFQDQRWLTMNPRIFLFHKKNSKRHIKRDIADLKYKTTYLGGFHHPTHLNGINFVSKPWFSGITDLPFHSEFPLILNAPFQSQELVDFDYREFFFLRAYSADPIFLPKVKPLPAGSISNDDLMKYDRLRCIGRSKKQNFQRSNYFKFAIVIDNPLGDTYPPLIGPLSDTLQIKAVWKSYESQGGFRAIVVPNAIKRDIP